MKMLSARDLRGKLGDLRKKLFEEREILLMSRGKPMALLTRVSESDWEEELKFQRQSRFGWIVGKIQQESLKKGTDKITEAEIEAEIQAVRKSRRV